jgi:phosphatidylinositol 3-kinase
MSLESKYLLSSDIDVDVCVKLVSLEGLSRPDEFSIKTHPNYAYATAAQDTELFLTCQIWVLGTPLTPLLYSTYKCFPEGSIAWNEWLVFPIKYRDLPGPAQLALTIWMVSPLPEEDVVVLGGTTVPFFDDSAYNSESLLIF